MTLSTQSLSPLASTDAGVPTFAELGVPRDLVEVLKRQGITTPFPIQVATVANGLEGRDLCGKAPTGSGKTLAFSIPLAARTERARPRRPRALVLVPTRELAAQVADVLGPLLAARGLRHVTLYGGVGYEGQLKLIRKGVDVVVACPGRLADLIERDVFRLTDVDFVVVDEADRMADMGFLPEVRRLLDRTSPQRQTLLFSATLDGDVDKLVKGYQTNPVRHETVLDDGDKGDVTHSFWLVEQPERTDVTARLVATHGPTIVFTRTKHRADRVGRQLHGAGVSAAVLHGGHSQNKRDAALARFADGKVEVLVATDVAARGIHVDDVACVVHYDMAGDEKDYVHRSGRTGRAGNDGIVVTLVGADQRKDANKLQKVLGHPVGVTPPGELAPAPPRRAVPLTVVRSEPSEPSRPRTSGAPRPKPAPRAQGTRSGAPAPKASRRQAAAAAGRPAHPKTKSQASGGGSGAGRTGGPAGGMGGGGGRPAGRASATPPRTTRRSRPR